MRKLILAVAVVLAMAGLTGCAGIVGSAYRAAVTRHDASACAGLKGKTLDEVEARLDLKPDTLGVLAGDKMEARFTKGNFEAEIVLNKEHVVESTLCGDSAQLQHQRIIKQIQQRGPGGGVILEGRTK